MDNACPHAVSASKAKSPDGAFNPEPANLWVQRTYVKEAHIGSLHTLVSRGVQRQLANTVIGPWENYNYSASVGNRYVRLHVIGSSSE